MRVAPNSIFTLTEFEAMRLQNVSTYVRNLQSRTPDESYRMHFCRAKLIEIVFLRSAFEGIPYCACWFLHICSAAQRRAVKSPDFSQSVHYRRSDEVDAYLPSPHSPILRPHPHIQTAGRGSRNSATHSGDVASLLLRPICAVAANVYNFTS